MSYFEYNVLFILITKQSSVFFLVYQNGESAKSKMVIVWSKCHDMKNNISPLCFLFVWFFFLVFVFDFVFDVLFCFVFSFSSPSADYNVLEKF